MEGVNPPSFVSNIQGQDEDHLIEASRITGDFGAGEHEQQEKQERK